MKNLILIIGSLLLLSTNNRSHQSYSAPVSSSSINWTRVSIRNVTWRYIDGGSFKTYIDVDSALAPVLYGIFIGRNCNVDHIGVYNRRYISGSSSVSSHAWARGIDIVEVWGVNSLSLDQVKTLAMQNGASYADIHGTPRHCHFNVPYPTDRFPV